MLRNGISAGLTYFHPESTWDEIDADYLPPKHHSTLEDIMRNRIIPFAFIASLLLLEPATAHAIYTENWQSVDNETFHDATDWDNSSYIRSETTVGDNGLLQDIIESYNYGNDGYMYVVVVENNTLVGYFRYPYSCDTCNESNPDPFGDMSNPGDFTPPGGSDWADTGNYNNIPSYPEPAEWMLWIAGLGVLTRLRGHGEKH